MQAEADQNLAERLNRAHEGFNEALRAVELAIPPCGVTCEVPLQDVGDGKWFLGYGKVSGQWRLYVVFKPGAGAHEPILTASRELRLRAIEVLPTLLSALRVEVQGQGATLNDGTVRLREIAERLRNQGLTGWSVP